MCLVLELDRRELSSLDCNSLVHKHYYVGMFGLRTSLCLGCAERRFCDWHPISQRHNTRIVDLVAKATNRCGYAVYNLL
jgi:hypothetical protein